MNLHFRKFKLNPDFDRYAIPLFLVVVVVVFVVILFIY